MSECQLVLVPNVRGRLVSCWISCNECCDRQFCVVCVRCNSNLLHTPIDSSLVCYVFVQGRDSVGCLYSEGILSGFASFKVLSCLLCVKKCCCLWSVFVNTKQTQPSNQKYYSAAVSYIKTVGVTVVVVVNLCCDLSEMCLIVTHNLSV
jgi:hypothetical protein